MPLFTRAGQAEIGVGARLFDPRRGLMATARVAVTDHLRVGMLVTGSVVRRPLWNHAWDGAEILLRHKSIYGEGFIGAESRPRVLRFGGLVGAGYGVTDHAYQICDEQGDDRNEGFGPIDCKGYVTVRHKPRYLRAYPQAYLALVPRGFWRIAAGARVPIMHDFESGHTRTQGEGFLSNILLLRRTRLELQFAGTPEQYVSIHLMLLARLGPGANHRGDQ